MPNPVENREGVSSRKLARRALLVCISEKGAGEQRKKWSMDEFAELARSAGFEIAGIVTLGVGKPHPATFVGSGQLQIVREALDSGCFFIGQSDEENGAASANSRKAQLNPESACECEVQNPPDDAARPEFILVNKRLSPVHQRNWRSALKLPVLTRADVIFDIFERNAQTAEGKLQVELARLKYDLPRIMHIFEEQSSAGGGIGTRGPGEKLHLKTKREIEARIRVLEKRLGKISRDRALRRARRAESAYPVVSLVGYTNAGKSSLLNALTGSSAEVDDRYFATLNPTVRRLELANGSIALLADTVGFIEDLPGELLAAFESTLEEISASDVLIHVVDLSRLDVLETVNRVNAILASRGLAEKPRITLLNKGDAPADSDLISGLLLSNAPAIVVSAKTRQGLKEASGLISDAIDWWLSHRGERESAPAKAIY
ncbi:MAG: GTPase HflX [bacterium]|jgi:GTP-binding protein HflX